MSRESSSLRIDCDPVEQPAATDPVDRAGWSALRISVSSRLVTRVFDRVLQSERASLYVPAFPIAAWFVQNWWALIEEPARSDQPAATPLTDHHFAWTQRHCLRNADPGSMLPALYLYSDGVNLHASWQADAEGEVPSMPGAFVDSGEAVLETATSVAAIEQFVNEVLDRVRSLGDDDVANVAARWTAIRTASIDEINFCRLAGRMGLDPFDSQLPEPVATLLEDIGDLDDPVVQDLTEVAKPAEIAEQWKWVQSTASDLGATTIRRPSDSRSGRAPWEAGYEWAEIVRGAAGRTDSSPVESVGAIARALNVSLTSVDRNHIPGEGISGIVGWRSSEEITVVGPRSPFEANARFLEARALCHALFSCRLGARLLTRAHTWDQQASRAFAAELLAPQAVLWERTGDWASQEDIDRLAHEFKVSTHVIQRQLQNSGVSIAD